MTTVYIAIGACFVLNLIVVIAFRAADRKDKTLKFVNQQVKNFRGEVNTTMNRLSATAKDCEQNISSRVDSANSVINQVAESLDMLLVHQKELSALDDVCRNYKVALEKLKTQTEQAEARIFAVQSEVRKAETVKDFVDNFQKDSDRLTVQMENLKADYVRLVASTEQDLKTTVSIQKEENNQMLASFEATLERYKANLSDFMAEEKQKYDEICRQQEEQAQTQLDTLEEKCREADASFAESRQELDQFKASLEAGVADLSVRRDSIFSDIETRTAELRQEAGSASLSMETRRDTLFAEMENKLAELKSEIDACVTVFGNKRDELFQSMDNRLAELNAELEASSTALVARREEIFEIMDKKLSDTVEDLDNAIKSTEDTLDAKLNDKEEEISASLVSYSEQLVAKEQLVTDKIVALGAEKDVVIADIAKAMEEKSQEVQQSIQELVEERDGVLDDIRIKMDERKAEIVASLEELAQERDETIQHINDAMAAKKNEIDVSMGELQTKKDTLVSNFDTYLEEKKAAFDEETNRLESDRQTFTQKCRNGLQDVLEESRTEGIAQLDKLKANGDEYMKVLAKSVSDSEKAHAMVLTVAYDKTEEARDHLDDYCNKIKDTENELDQVRSQVTEAKQELWEMQQQQRSLTNELGILFSDQDKVRSEVREAKNKRLNEEANLVRLKGQQSAIAEKQAKKGSGKKVSIEEMDLFMGEEETVDVSDED